MTDVTNTNEETVQITQAQAKAVNVLIAAAGVAQKAGAFSLADAKHVFEAINAFRTETDEVVVEDPPNDAVAS